MLVDLRSDTVTKPSVGMLKAISSAKLGDDVFEEDPTIIKLEAMVAEMLGKESSLFFPSGTMANQVAIKTLSSPPGELICDKNSHVYLYESGGIAFNSGLSVKLLDGELGKVTAESVSAAINEDHVYLPESQIVSIENTHNRGGGSIYSMEELDSIVGVLKDTGIRFHLDGARLFNAVTESDYSASEFSRPFDTVSVCLSKGLGAPVGSVLAGSAANIRKARKLRKVMGGGMRQVGILGAACIYALENNIEKLKDDHIRAKHIAEAILNCSMIKSTLPVETNIIVAELKEGLKPDDILSKLRENNILSFAFGKNAIRMVTHLDLTDEMADHVSKVVRNL